MIVPTDSPTRAQVCLRDLPRNTKYPGPGDRHRDEQPSWSNRSRVSKRRNATVRFVPYDKPFNFSDKCNLGAEAATGERLIFFNDDVETDAARLDPESDRAAGESGGGRGRAKTSL